MGGGVISAHRRSEEECVAQGSVIDNVPWGVIALIGRSWARPADTGQELQH